MKEFLSVIIPLFNEGKSLPVLHSHLNSILRKTRLHYEIIYVNDGSTDNSQTVLRSFTDSKHVKVIQLKRNYGQTSAIAAGIDHAIGNKLIFIDADLQNDPDDIPALLRKLNEGYDVVSGWRKKRKDNLFTKRLPSVLANVLLRIVLKVPIHDFGCTLKIYKKEYLSQSRLYGEMHRLLPFVAMNEGASIAEIEVNHYPRKYGKSHYTLDRTFKVIIDMIMLKLFYGYSSKPAYVFGAFGIFLFLIALLLAIFTLWERFYLGAYVHRNPIFLLSMFALMGSIQFILLGFLTEFIMRTYYESQDKPTYRIKRIIT